MRSLVAAIALIGCGGEELTAQQEYEALEAEVAVDCGTYERNYAGDAPFALHLCGIEPDIGCVNGAIAAAPVAKLTYKYLDPHLAEPREQNYFAGDGKLVWIGYYQHEFREPDWYRADCAAVVAEPYTEAGMSCWKLLGADCVAR